MNWKKLLSALGVVAIALLLVLFGGGMMLDGNVHLQTEATLDAPPEMVFALVADPAGVIEWWTGADKEPGSEAMAGMTIEQGPADPTAPGATVFFKMGDTLSEEWTLVSVNSPTEVVWDVDFQMFLVLQTIVSHCKKLVSHRPLLAAMKEFLAARPEFLKPPGSRPATVRLS